MAKRPIRMESDPADEKITEVYVDQAHQVGARFAWLFPDTRQEKLSSISVAPPVGYKKQPSMVDHIKGLVRSEHLRWAAESSGRETFEEADDFEVGDDYDPTSPYEGDFDPIVPGPVPAPSTPPGTPSAAAAKPQESVAAAAGTPPAQGSSSASEAAPPPK